MTTKFLRGSAGGPRRTMAFVGETRSGQGKGGTERDVGKRKALNGVFTTSWLLKSPLMTLVRRSDPEPISAAGWLRSSKSRSDCYVGVYG